MTSLTQTKMDAQFILSDLSQADRNDWERLLDRFAAAGTLPPNNIGSIRAKKFADLGFIRYWKGQYHLTELGQAAEQTPPDYSEDLVELVHYIP